MRAQHQGESCLITLDDAAAVARQGFADEVIALLQAGELRLVLDLSRIPLLTSQGLGSLVLLRNALGKRRMGLTLTGMSDGNRRLLEVTRLDRLFTLA